MDLLQYAKTCKSSLDKISNKDFASNFISLRAEAYEKYHNGLIISNSHGINYFENVIKFWDNPISYIPYLKEKELNDYSNGKYLDDYEKNFILILMSNKNE